MAPRFGWRALVALTALVGLGLVGCGRTGEALPPAPELLAKSATAMAAVKTTSIDIQVDQALAGSVPISRANGKITSAGEAAGTATLIEGGSPFDVEFVISQNNLYLKGATGRFHQVPIALARSIYDPTAVLSADRGIAALMRTTSQATTEEKEDVNGVPAYRVRTALDPNLVSTLVPRVSGVNSGLVWLDAASGRLVKARLDVPTEPGRQDGSTAPVTVTLSDFDAPVTITPPS